MSLIELKNISFAYDNESEVFNNFSLKIEKSKCLVIHGDNGSGKTTLFRILNGLSFPQSGKYFFDGTEITRDYLKNNYNSKRFHKQIGYLFQNPDVMLFNSSVYDEIAFGVRQLGLSSELVNERVTDCMELFNISDLSGKAPYHLSGGQKKKVALSAVLALNPDVLILDEPLAGLDKSAQKMIINLLSDLKSVGKTLIIATHNDELSAKLSDDILQL